MHLSANHPEWCAAWPSILARAAIFRRALTKPCQFCLEQRLDLQSHWKRGHVITSCCFLEIFAGGHGTSTDRRDSFAESALGAKDQELAMFSDLISVCHPAEAPATPQPGHAKRPRRGNRPGPLEETLDDPMHPADQASPRMSSTARPHRPSNRGHRKPSSTKGKGKGRESPSHPRRILSADRAATDLSGRGRAQTRIGRRATAAHAFSIKSHALRCVRSRKCR